MNNMPLLFCLILLVGACKQDPDDSPKPLSTSINQIMPLGASRVEGARPAFESFRYELWKELLAEDWTFDFVGTQTDEANYPAFAGEDFDPDHEGRGGWTSGQILAGLPQWLEETGAPDIVLFSSPGGNDALENLPYEQTAANLNAIVELLQAANPDISILIERLAPARSDLMTPPLARYFERLQAEVDTLAATKATPSSRILVVDMATGFSDDLLADDVHYNAAGAAFVAQRYATMLVDVLEE